MRSLRRWCLLVVLALAFAPAPVHAASFAVEGPALRIYGDIEPGDDAKFLAAWQQGFPELRIQSNGGDMLAALAIGEVIAKRQPAVVIDGPCLQHCANFWFLASRARRVLRDGLVCFRSAPARTESELREQIVREEFRFSTIKEDEIEAAVTARLPAAKAVTPRVDMLLRYSGADPQILREAGKIIIPFDYVDSWAQSRQEFLLGKQGFWCPTPEAFKRYNVDGQFDWYPGSDRSLFQIGQRLNESWIFSARLTGKGDPIR